MVVIAHTVDLCDTCPIDSADPVPQSALPVVVAPVVVAPVATSHVGVAQRSKATASGQPLFVRGGLIQRKLMVGAANDVYEQEADMVARQVVDSLFRNRDGGVAISPGAAERGKVRRAFGASLRGVGDSTGGAGPHGQAPLEQGFTRRPQTTMPQRLVHRSVAPLLGRTGGAVDAGVESRIRSAGDGSTLEPTLRRSMEGAFDADFSGVRVHDDATSNDLNRQIQAKAFTSGQDVFFSDGAYQPDTRGGQELIAHELTHVVQQGQGGNDTAQRVQRSIDTFGGKFDAIQYEATYGTPADGTQQVGGVIDLAFTPNELVDGKVGLVQTGNAKRGGATDIQATDAGKNARAQKSTDVDEGRFLDRSNRKENPVFGLENTSAELAPGVDAEGISMTTDAGGNRADQRNRAAAEAGTTVAKADPAAVVDAAKVSEKAGQVGWNDKVKGAKPATLRDEPGRTRAWNADTGTGEDISMSFETAALGLSGAIEGAYLGSVEWGFIAPADAATARPLPFKMISRGVPSEAFMVSAQLWNDNASVDQGGGGTKRLSLPVAMTTHRTDPAIDVLLSDPGTAADVLRTALTARVALLRTQIPDDIEAQITALRATSIDDREAADVFQDTLAALNAQFRDLKAQITAASTNKRTAQRDLTTAQTGLDQVNRNLNFFTRKMGGGKARVVAATALVATQQAAVDQAGATGRTAGLAQDALGPQINAAKNDPGLRTSLAEYRDSLMAVQNKLSDARSRQLEIDALLRELGKLPPAS